MLKNIVNLKDVVLLDKQEQKNINGGFRWWCRRRSNNVSGAGSPSDNLIFINSDGCYIYEGMSWNSSPNCPPGSFCYEVMN